MEMQILWGLLVFILGLCLGSFANVIILRLPKGESIVRPRSHCPKCQAPVRFYDNIPVLSYFFLRGKCRNCRASISWRYPLVELITGLLFVAIFLKVGVSWTLVEYLWLAFAGVVVSVIDLDHRILPDVFTLSGVCIGLIGAAINPERSFYDSLFGVLAGGGFLFLVAYVYEAIRGEEGMGGGDIKLLAWIGAVLGWQAIIFTILISSITGSLAGLIVAAIQKSGMKTAIPFGPFLFLAAILYVFVGPDLMRVYLSVFFPFT